MRKYEETYTRYCLAIQGVILVYPDVSFSNNVHYISIKTDLTSPRAEFSAHKTN